MGCASKITGAATAALDSTTTETKWLSHDCLDINGDQSAYVYVYLTVSKTEEYGFLLSYGANSKCTGTYTTLNFKGDPVTAPELLVTILKNETPTGMPQGYTAILFHNPSSNSDQYTVGYQSGSTMYSPMSSIKDTYPGNAWSDWASADKGKFANFIGDVTTGIRFDQVSGIPANQ